MEITIKIVTMLNNKVIPFLTDLHKNNNREWFTENKSRYVEANADFVVFVDNIIQHLTTIDSSLIGLEAKNCVYRIYRDVRFSKDKTPYKTHFGALISAGGRKSKKAGFYIHIEPAGSTIVGSGIFRPEADILKALRSDFYTVPEELLEIIEDAKFKNTFGGLWDFDKLKLALKGFPKDFEHIDLLKYKSYVTSKEFSHDEIVDDNFLENIIEVYKVAHPLNRLINAIIDDMSN